MSEHFKVAIIGAGPGGLGAACNAAKQGLSHILFEKRHIGNTIYDYQLRKHVMAEPNKLPLRAHVEFKAGSRESILEDWERAVRQCSVNVRKAEVSSIKKNGAQFQIGFGEQGEVVTADHVVLAIGMQGSPRKLGCPGEDQAHVAYTLADPDAFEDKEVVVVGAGDAAIENALALAEKNSVTLINRGREFARAKDANIALISKAISSGKIKCFYDASIAKVESSTAVVATPEGEVTIPCNHLIARIGCVMPRKFVESCGIVFPNQDPNTPPVVDGRYESNVKSLFIVGALIGYPLIKQAINQGHEVIEHILGNPVEPADQVLINERLAGLPGAPNDNLRMIREALPLFKDLSDPQFREMLIDSTVHSKSDGEVIFRRNDYTDSFWSVVRGSVSIELEDGRSFPIEQGRFFGEMGLISGRRRTATVRARGQAILLETPRKQMIKLIASVEPLKRSLDEIFMYRALQTSIFPDIEREFLEKVVQKAKFKRFKKGEVLFKEGDVGDVLYVVRKGSVKISRRDLEGRDIAQTYIPAGNYVGEMALLSEAPLPRSASATAAVATETILIEKQDFLELLQSSPPAKKRIMQLAEERRVQNLTGKQRKDIGAMLDFVFDKGVTDADNLLVIDSDLCIGCDNCEHACAATHDGYSRLDRKGGQSFASVQVPISCRHCENPLCMTDCPPDALTRLPNGEVVIRDSCIGCGNCSRNCPYGVIQMVHEHPHEPFSLLSFFGLKRKSQGSEDAGATKAAKCDLCSKLQGGPACVRACPTGAAMRINPGRLVELIASKEEVGQ